MQCGESESNIQQIRAIVGSPCIEDYSTNSACGQPTFHPSGESKVQTQTKPILRKMVPFATKNTNGSYRMTGHDTRWISSPVSLLKT